MRKFLTILAASVFMLCGLPSSPSYAQDTKTIADLLQEATTNSAKPEFTIYFAALKAGDPKLLYTRFEQ